MSVLPVNTVFPSGLNATARTQLSCCMGSPSGLPVTVSHRRAVTAIARAVYQLARNLDARANVAEAEKLLATVGERRVWRRLLVLKARCLPPAEALALAQAEMEREAIRL